MKGEETNCKCCYQVYPKNILSRHEKGCNIYRLFIKNCEAFANSATWVRNSADSTKFCFIDKNWHCKKMLNHQMYLIRHEIFCSKTHRYISGQKCLLCNSSSQKKIKSHMHACHRDLLGLGSGRKHCKHCKKQFQYTPQMEAHEFTCVFYQKYL